MRKTVTAILLLAAVLCCSAYADDLYARSSQHFFSLGYSMSLKSVEGGTVMTGGPVFDRTRVEAFTTDAPFGYYVSVAVKLDMHQRYNDGDWTSYNLKTDTHLSTVDIVGLGFPFQLGPTIELTLGIGLAMRGTIVMDFTGKKFLDIFPYVDLYMGAGARADMFVNFTDNLFMDVSAAIDYEFIGAYVDGRNLEKGRCDNVLFPLEAKATLGLRF